jgi:hypothetical protein
MPELCDMLNKSADGRSNWTTGEVRERLRRAGALIYLPEDPSVPETDIPEKFRRKSKRRRFYTTPDLLLTKVGTVYTSLIESMSEDDATFALTRV